MTHPPHIIAGFSAKHDSLISRGICFVTRGMHSHILMLSPDGRELGESTAVEFYDPVREVDRDGVRILPASDLMARRGVELRAIDHPFPELVWQHAKALDGVPYDNKPLLGYIINRPSYQDEDKLNCVEWFRVAMRRAGHDPFPDSVQMLTPRDFYLISKELPKE